jgi:hypothetical protein
MVHVHVEILVRNGSWEIYVVATYIYIVTTKPRRHTVVIKQKQKIRNPRPSGLRMRPWPFITFSLQYRYFLTRIEHHRCTMISQRLAVLAALIAILMAIVYWININVGDGVQRVGHSMALITDYARQTSTVAYTGEMQGLTVIGAGFPRTGTYLLFRSRKH